MDSLRVTWNKEQDLYYIHVPGFPDSVVTAEQLRELRGLMTEHMSGSQGLLND